MFYKPNFCAECGARIEAEARRFWSNGKFCRACAKRFRRASFVKAASLVAALAGGGFLAGRALRPSAPPVVIATMTPARESSIASVSSNGNANSAAQDSAKQSDSSNAKSGGLKYGKSFVETPPDPNEIISSCGARTKKGTPCQRRVRGVGRRCFQHTGKPAMLPPEKLIVQGKPPEGK